MHTLFYYHLVASVVHILSFAFLLQVVPQKNEKTYQLVIPYASYGEELGMQFLYEDAFGPISIATLLLVNEAVTAVSHLTGLLGFGLYRKQMVEDDRHLEVIRRYVEYAVTAAILEMTIYLLVGGRDLNLLLAIVMTNVIVQVLGYMLERSKNQQRQVYLNVSGFALLLVPVVSFLTIGPLVEGFLALALYYTVLYALFGLHSLLHVLSQDWRTFIDKDLGFVVLGVATKEILTWMVVALQAKLMVDHSVATEDSLADYVDLDGFLLWLPLLGILTAVLAIIASSRISIRDSYEAV
tara:strand:- start:2917 stop:3804 length:888 start_codon:yes stop_codon:yes gene_type:complete